MIKANIPLSIRSDLTKLADADCLVVAAIGGYIVFLPLLTLPDLSTLALVFFGLLALYTPYTLRPHINRVDYYVILAIVSAAICSVIVSDELFRGLRFLVYVCLNMFLLLLATTVDSKTRLRFVAICVALFGVLHLAVLLIFSQIAGDFSASELVRHTRMSTLIVPNDALILGLCLPFFAFIFMDDETRMNSKAYLSLALYLALSVYVSYRLQSKIALLSLLTAMLVLSAAKAPAARPAWLSERRLLVVVSTISLLLLMGAAAWFLGNQSTTRLSLWAEASTAHTSLSAVAFGAGPNTFLYNPFSVDWAFDKGNFIIPWAHNLFIEAYNEQGLFGLAAIIMFSLIPVWRALQIKDRSVRALMLATTVTFCLVALFEVTLTRRFYFALLALLYGLSAAQGQEVSDE